MMSEGKTSFRTYCESTSLHGWQYIYHSSQKGWRLLWIGMVLSSVIIAFCFVFKQTSEFTKATVVTTVDTTTAPLSDVYFPAVTICNINQVRRSFLEELGIHKNWTVVDMIFREFYTGSAQDLTPEERQIMESLFVTQSYVEREIEYSYTSSLGAVNKTALKNWRGYLKKYYSYIVSGTHFTNFAVQEPGGTMILKASYGGQERDGASTDFNPYFGTDVGICSIMKPQLSFNQSLDHLPFWSKLFEANDNILPGSEVGKANGLTVLLDAETYDYTYHLRAGEGFKLSVHHHLDQPIMSIKEIDISVGSESQVAVTTSLTTTTAEARDRFQPMERGCYFEGELSLKYLPKQFYRYEMSNCLFEAAYEEILHRCNCTPSFHQTGIREYPRICTGTRLKCMKTIIQSIGKYNVVGDIGSQRQPCLAACEDQVNLVTETSSSFPNSETFHRREEFCLIVIKLLRTCSTMKAAALTDKFPHICQHLRLIRNNQKKDICPLGYWNPSVDHPELLANSTVDPSKSVAELIRKEMFHYAKSNMALVNVYIKDPVVTRIKRDQKIPIIGFVANTGGLLGLCMGFSLVSAFEIIYHCMMTLCWKSFHFYRRQTMNVRNSANKKDSTRPQTLGGESEETTRMHQARRNSSEKLTSTTTQEIGTISQALCESRLDDDDPTSYCCARDAATTMTAAVVTTVSADNIIETVSSHANGGSGASDAGKKGSSGRICCSLFTLDGENEQISDSNGHGNNVPDDVTIQQRTSSTSNGHCQGGQRQKSQPQKAGSARLPPPMKLKKCVLIDSECSLHKYSLPSSLNKRTSVAAASVSQQY